jgi:hypothetical protein
MNRLYQTLLTWPVTVALVIANAASAHHAGTAFDESRRLKVTGVVKEFKWVNPHCWLYLMVPNAKGELEEWQFEGGAISILGRAGWNSKLLRPGDKIVVSVKPLKSGEHGGEFSTVTKEDGKTYGWGQL